MAASLVRLALTWRAVLTAVFIVVSSWSILVAVVEPAIIGSHAVVYRDAAWAWLTGGNPWAVGPPRVVFAGPPPMLLAFAPFALLPAEISRFGWVVLALLLSILTIHRLGLPSYWLAFPPLVEAIVLGHPEILVLALLVLGGSKASGLAPVVKVYAALPLLAERRFRALAAALAVVVVTVPILPWSTFISEFPKVLANLARQNVGDSAFGQPVLTAIAVIALVALGPRRALWVAVPVIWPFAQPIYKVMSLPVLPPLVALAWAIPMPGFTLVGVIAWSVGLFVQKRRVIPAWLSKGLEPMADPGWRWPDAAGRTSRAPAHVT